MIKKIVMIGWLTLCVPLSWAVPSWLKNLNLPEEVESFYSIPPLDYEQLDNNLYIWGISFINPREDFYAYGKKIAIHNYQMGVLHENTPPEELLDYNSILSNEQRILIDQHYYQRYEKMFDTVTYSRDIFHPLSYVPSPFPDYQSIMTLVTWDLNQAIKAYRENHGEDGRKILQRVQQLVILPHTGMIVFPTVQKKIYGQLKTTAQLLEKEGLLESSNHIVTLQMNEILRDNLLRAYQYETRIMCQSLLYEYRDYLLLLNDNEKQSSGLLPVRDFAIQLYEFYQRYHEILDHYDERKSDLEVLAKDIKTAPWNYKFLIPKI